MSCVLTLQSEVNFYSFQTSTTEVSQVNKPSSFSSSGCYGQNVKQLHIWEARERLVDFIVLTLEISFRWQEVLYGTLIIFNLNCQSISQQNAFFFQSPAFWSGPSLSWYFFYRSTSQRSSTWEKNVNWIGLRASTQANSLVWKQCVPAPCMAELAESGLCDS